jgi:hypothetical protein
MYPVDSSSRYGMFSKYTDVAEIFLVGVSKPCERWPPCGRSRPMMRSCGFMSAVYTCSHGAAPSRVRLAECVRGSCSE